MEKAKKIATSILMFLIDRKPKKPKGYYEPILIGNVFIDAKPKSV